MVQAFCSIFFIQMKNDFRIGFCLEKVAFFNQFFAELNIIIYFTVADQVQGTVFIG